MHHRIDKRTKALMAQRRIEGRKARQVWNLIQMINSSEVLHGMTVVMDEMNKVVRQVGKAFSDFAAAVPKDESGRFIGVQMPGVEAGYARVDLDMGSEEGDITVVQMVDYPEMGKSPVERVFRKVDPYVAHKD